MLSPSARPASPRMCPEFFPIKSTTHWETQAAAAQSFRHPCGRRAPEPERARESQCPSDSLRALLLFQIFFLRIPEPLQAFSFSANPVLGWGSLPLPWANSSYAPSLLLTSDVIRFLCIRSRFLSPGASSDSTSRDWFKYTGLKNKHLFENY